mmetsp:Transcript_27953/g.39711  ORF Transcript_27953/g.39711 Transcript_27953/m.39711 type:complete len:162 (-) Transcript_27953:240-725(-)
MKTMTMMNILVLLVLISTVSAYQVNCVKKNWRSGASKLGMIELQADTATYIGMFVATMVPSLALVKFVGDQADKSRDSLSADTKERFKRAMMEQPGANFAIPSTEEEDLKKQIAKAYMQDKDVDVAVLEEKLKKRAQWRKEVLAQRKSASLNQNTEDEDGW